MFKTKLINFPRKFWTCIKRGFFIDFETQFIKLDFDVDLVNFHFIGMDLVNFDSKSLRIFMKILATEAARMEKNYFQNCNNLNNSQFSLEFSLGIIWLPLQPHQTHFPNKTPLVITTTIKNFQLTKQYKLITLFTLEED